MHAIWEVVKHPHQRISPISLLRHPHPEIQKFPTPEFFSKSDRGKFPRKLESVTTPIQKSIPIQVRVLRKVPQVSKKQLGPEMLSTEQEMHTSENLFIHPRNSRSPPILVPIGEGPCEDWDEWYMLCENRFCDLNDRTMQLESEQEIANPREEILNEVHTHISTAINDFSAATTEIINNTRETANNQTEFLRNEFHSEMQAITQKANAEIQGMVNCFEAQIQNVVNSYSNLGMISKDEIRVHVQSELNATLPKVEKEFMQQVEVVARHSAQNLKLISKNCENITSLQNQIQNLEKRFRTV